jgi:hypothetical protein
VRQLRAPGALVAICCRDEKKLREAADAIGALAITQRLCAVRALSTSSKSCGCSARAPARRS